MLHGPVMLGVWTLRPFYTVRPNGNADKALNLQQNCSDKVNGNEPGVFPGLIQNG
jgi:hypothetical protein